MALRPKLVVLLALLVAAPPPVLASGRSAQTGVAFLDRADAVDSQSYARPREARVTHVDLDLEADMTRHRFIGTATLDIATAPGAKAVVLDALGLDIAAITDVHGRPLRWTLGDGTPDKGAPLTVELGGARRIIIRYASRPDASALQWMPPAATSGKVQPLLYSQGEDINNRSWIPTQDSPGIRQTWNARIVVPAGLVALMSADRLTPAGEPVAGGKRAFRFRMDHPVPPYLIAIAIGDFRFRALGPRTGVWAEPAMLDRAAAELVDTEKMVAAAEALYGPYRWGRYDVLVLPPSFPAGGMENATLTFVTPTFITGDRANIDLVAHELSHSWSGNLVTNATWKDLWLNEGFTTYVENRVIEALYGSARAHLEADLDWRELAASVSEAPKDKPGRTRLYDGEDGSIPYMKGAAFLRTIEAIVGRARFDAYLRGYFDRNAFRPQTTAGFLADIRANLVKGDSALEARLMLDDWAYGAGLPSNAVHPVAPEIAVIEAEQARFTAGAPASALVTSGWGTKQWKFFLDGLPRQMSADRLADLDHGFALSQSTNAYIRTAWLQLVVANRYEPAMGSLESFLQEVGRPLFIGPLYRSLMAQGEWGQSRARKYFAEAKSAYHPTVAAGLSRLTR